MPDDNSKPISKTKKDVVAQGAPASEDQAPEEPAMEEVVYKDYPEAVTAFLNEVAQLATPFLDSEVIGMITVVAVTADGKHVGTHEVLKIPETAGDDKMEQARIRRQNAGSRIQTLAALKAHSARLHDWLANYISNLDA